MTIAELNRFDKDDFTDALAGIYESSPWVPQKAHKHQPFKDLAGLQAVLRRVVDDSEPEARLELINAHPDLGGKLGKKVDLTAESKREQSRLGLDALDEGEYEAFCKMNQSYRDKFGFPFIICVGKVRNREQILTAFEQRLKLSPKEEFSEAMTQIHEIAGLRLDALIQSS